MAIWLHSTILAATLVATAAVGVAGASYYGAKEDSFVKKADRLPIAAASCNVADLSGTIGCGGGPRYVTIEDRSEAGQNVSTLVRMPAP